LGKAARRFRVQADTRERRLSEENTPSHPGEKANDSDSVAELASLAQLYVNDVFAVAHRAHAPTEGVAHRLPAVAGLLMEREVTALKCVRENPKHPFVAISGGAKISDKIGILDEFMERMEVVLVGGGNGERVPGGSRARGR
jgi:3-phosphoglycerate kinase